MIGRRQILSLTGAGILALAGCAAPPAGPVGTAPPGSFLQTDAEVVVVDFFDMYCHTCQTAAAHVNDLYQLVQRRGLGSKIRFYAIGWGNTPLEAETYRTRFKVPFPVIPDRDLAISSRYGKFRPPLLLALRRDGGAWNPFYQTKDVRVKPEQVLAAIWRP
jgi:thiol-disulfide isomerase/thioredoxin